MASLHAHALALAWLSIVLSLCGLSAASSAPVSSYPLAVRNPYLSAWLPHNIANHAPTAQAQFWAGQNLTWPILARVNGKTYTLFGEPYGVRGATAATQNAITFTATHTLVQLTAGPATIQLDFFSPVSPADYVRQSLPYSYVTVTASGASNPTVQVFSGLDETWTAATGLTASFNASGDALYYSLAPAQQTPYTEKNNMAAWGTVIYAAQPVAGTAVTYQSAGRTTVQQAFVASGELANTTSTYASGHLCAFAIDLGAVGSDGKSARFVVGYDRVQAINFLGSAYTSYFRSQFPAIANAVAHVFSDYAAANSESQTLDAKVVSKGNAFSADYTDLLALSLRQIYGAQEVIVPASSLSTADVIIVLKEISSDGDGNTIDVIYPTMPALYLLSPDWLQLLLKPFLIYLNTNQWPHPYIPHDLGGYPNLLGHNNGQDEQIIVEVTGFFFALAQLYNQATGASSAWLQPYFTKLTTAGDYLVNNGLFPASQPSTVDAIPATANQTGLAQAAALGLKALGKALNLQNYTTQGSSFGARIYPTLGTDNASDPTHFTYNYGLPKSWVTTFDLTVDNVLGLNTFPTAAATMQANWYASKFLPNGGITYSYNVDFVVTEWLFSAAALSDKVAPSLNLQSKAVSLIHGYITNGLNNVPFPTKFNVQGSNIGLYINNKARSTVGAVWMPMLLNGNWGQGIS